MAYRASKHVRLGVPDEHSYNMFLSFLEQMHRLRLWSSHIPVMPSQAAFMRLTTIMKNKHLMRKRSAQQLLEEETPYGG
jgi:hypothetical protein